MISPCLSVKGAELVGVGVAAMQGAGEHTGPVAWPAERAPGPAAAAGARVVCDFCMQHLLRAYVALYHHCLSFRLGWGGCLGMSTGCYHSCQACCTLGAARPLAVGLLLIWTCWLVFPAWLVQGWPCSRSRALRHCGIRFKYGVQTPLCATDEAVGQVHG